MTAPEGKMKPFSFLHAADLHLDSPLLGLRRRAGDNANPFIEATRKAFEKLVTLAIERKVAFVLLSGDLFDGDWRDFASGQFVVKQFARLDREGIPVFLIRGNHDTDNIVTKSLPVPKNVTWLAVRSAQTVILDSLRVAIHGRGFATRHVEDNVVLAYPQAHPGYFNIGMLHTSLTGRDGHGTYAPCSLDDLKSRGYQYWALGHIHQREIVCETPRVVYPGNVQGRHSKENDAKGCVVVRVEDDEVAGVEFCACDVVRFATIQTELTDAASMEQAYARFRETAEAAVAASDGRPLAVRVRLSGATTLHRLLAAERRALEEGLQAVASSVDADMLIEKVVDTTTNVSQGTTAPVPQFHEALMQAAGDERLLAALSQTLASLRAALPKEVIDLFADADATPEEYLRLAVADAMAMLSPEIDWSERA